MYVMLQRGRRREVESVVGVDRKWMSWLQTHIFASLVTASVLCSILAVHLLLTNMFSFRIFFLLAWWARFVLSVETLKSKLKSTALIFLRVRYTEHHSNRILLLSVPNYRMLSEPPSNCSNDSQLLHQPGHPCQTQGPWAASSLPYNMSSIYFIFYHNWKIYVLFLLTHFHQIECCHYAGLCY